jgi:hypothetical protein
MKTTFSRRAALAAGAALAAAVLAGCGTLEVSQADMVVQRADPRSMVELTLSPAQVRIGQPVAMRVRAAQPGHLYVVQVGSEGRRMSLVYPNEVEPGNRLAAPGAVVAIPGPGWALVSQGPAGVGYFVALVTAEAQDLPAFKAALAERRIEVRGSYGAAIATLTEVANRGPAQ